MFLLDDQSLERSAVVANCRMNRERGLAGTNGYDVELGFAPLDRRRVDQPFRWLDLCCGTARALIEAARSGDAPGSAPVEITGVDLVGMFAPTPGPLPGLNLIEASVSTWAPRPDQRFDLITCVHGLHYVGDKLGLIARASRWLCDDGEFVATLDLSHVEIRGLAAPERHLRSRFRSMGVEYDPKRRLVRLRGVNRVAAWPYRYLGADDTAGPNFTGQPAVRSVYEVAGEPPHPAGGPRREKSPSSKP